MEFEFFALSLLNGISYGLLLFMLSAGFTLIFSMLGVLNFAHATFYMLGAYLAYSITHYLNFWMALFLAPVIVGILGALFEKYCLRKIHKLGHISELLATFGLSYIILELIQLIWGRSVLVYELASPLQGALFNLDGFNFSKSRAFVMLLALSILFVMWLIFSRTRIGLIIQASLQHPNMLEALGHNVPRVYQWVFGAGAALAALAGVVGGSIYVTEPSMALSLGSIIFVVVVVGGLGSLIGAFWASLLIGVTQTLATNMHYSINNFLLLFDVEINSNNFIHSVFDIKLAQLAPVVPYLLLIFILIFRPQGIFGHVKKIKS